MLVNPDAVSALARRQEAHEAVDAVFESLRQKRDLLEERRRKQGEVFAKIQKRKKELKEKAEALDAARAMLDEERRWLRDALQSRWMREAAEHAATVRVRLDIGGQVFEVPASVLQREPDSVLARVADEAVEAEAGRAGGAAAAESSKEEDGESPAPVFFDRDWWVFRFVVQWLREGDVALPASKESLKLLYQEARFFRMHKLRDAVRSAFQRIVAAEAELDAPAPALSALSAVAPDPLLVADK